MINFAYAQSATQQPSMFASFIPLILIFLIFYFLLIDLSKKSKKNIDYYWIQLKEAMKF